MLITERMCRVELLFPREDEVRLWDTLGRFGRLHPGEFRQAPGLARHLSFVDVGELERVMLEAAEFLSVDLSAPLSDWEISPLNLPLLRERMGDVSREIDEAREKQRALLESERRLHRDLDHIQLKRTHVEMLEPLELDIGALQALERFRVMVGTLPRESLEPLERSLSQIPHSLLPYRRDRHRVELFAVCLPQHLVQFRRVLESALFRETEIPEDLHGAPRDALHEIARQEQQLNERLLETEKEIVRFEDWRASRSNELANFLRINAATLAAITLTGQTDTVGVAVGWVPKSDISRLKTILSQEQKWVVEITDLPYANSPTDLGCPIPAKLRNPPFFRAFEGLILVYGAPVYGGFDPTIVFTALYVLVFGMMFGDVGHGGLLALVGIVLRFWPRLRVGLKRAGMILMGVGTSSAVFGLLYGSVFGYEDILSALWFRPMGGIGRLLLYAMIFGAGVIVVGILANILTMLIRGRYRQLLYERFGLLGLWFYVAAVALAVKLTQGGEMSSPFLIALALLPLLLMPIVKFTCRWLGKSSTQDDEEHGFTGLVVAGVDLLEGLLVYLSNSISFVRVAAFALNHAALSLAIFQLGSMLRSLPAGGLWYALAIAGGNLLILILEGGIVAIQTLRLGFYEFFSKFFQEEGKPYGPFTYNMAVKRR